ncbi:MAG: carboxymuconolactone decarboxylase family protein [Promethearchaeati archaeon SRVP18_Atabeyarchaeia-1]
MSPTRTCRSWPSLKERCPKKKLLMTLTIDAEHGSVQGATSLAQRAMKLGATKEEIIETLRIAYYVGGNRALFTSTMVLQTAFK